MKEEEKEKMLAELLFFEENFKKYSKIERLKILYLIEKQYKIIEKKNLILSIIDKINNL